MTSRGTTTIITIAETDEVGTPTATYVYSESVVDADGAGKKKKKKKKKGRIDVVPPSLLLSSSPSRSSSLTSLLNVFLPAGYPHSVSSDYLEYRIYDTLQAFLSAIAGLLSSRAVLQGVGVGDATASLTSALLLQILQDSSGRIATVLFAHRIGTAIEPECKTYRLAADVFNDAAIILDCLSPLVGTKAGRVGVLSAAGVMRALCGVAGASSKASLSAHFARWGNLGEVNAVGSLLVSNITTPLATWTALICLLTLHLATNYAAVRAVHMTSLNRQRANIVFSALLGSDPGLDVDSLSSGEYNSYAQKEEGGKEVEEEEENGWKILTPKEVARRERTFERDGVLRWTFESPPSLSTSSSSAAAAAAAAAAAGGGGGGSSQILGSCRIGVPLKDLLLNSPTSISRSTSRSSTAIQPQPQPSLPHLLNIFTSESYILSISVSTSTPRTNTNTKTCTATIILKTHHTPQTHLKAWTHALLAAKTILTSSSSSFSSTPHLHPQKKEKEKEKYNDDDEADNKNSEIILSVLSHTLSFLNASARFERYLNRLSVAGWDVDDATTDPLFDSWSYLIEQNPVIKAKDYGDRQQSRSKLATDRHGVSIDSIESYTTQAKLPGAQEQDHEK
ncbi:hypothetical protein VTN00DRAFT_1320 [Thermoascus crustaceus]|uniref:uncharacterized protein n=1 Tax=Thermoascus crustaceus TaxID=5088 RepID=UPI003742ABA9